MTNAQGPVRKPFADLSGIVERLGGTARRRLAPAVMVAAGAFLAFLAALTAMMLWEAWHVIGR